MHPAPLTELDEQQCALAVHRWQLLRPVVQDGVPLTVAARDAGVPLRSAQRWLARYRSSGLAGLARTGRSDRGMRRLPEELVQLVEGLALRRPSPSVASICRWVQPVAVEQGWPVPSYSTVYSVVTALDPQLLTLAHDGPAALRDRYELVYRRESDRPNQLWQADHIELDLLVLDHAGGPARPWLTVVLDDCSRAVAGFTVFLGVPSALNLSLALRQAIWHKTDPGWPVHGLPDVLYADHGSDFSSDHLAQVTADLHIRLVHSAVARPQGRGKLECLFGTITTELLPDLHGHLVRGKPASPPATHAARARHRHPLLDHRHLPPAAAQRDRPTAAAGLARRRLAAPHPRHPRAAGAAAGQGGHSPVVHRDGIRFQGLRYLDPTLAAYVGESVTIRYDPRDLGEIRVFHRDRFLCRAISPQHAGQALTLKDIQAARTAHRRALRSQLDERAAAVGQYVPTHHAPQQAAAPPRPVAPLPRQHESEQRPAPRSSRLHTYLEDKA